MQFSGLTFLLFFLAVLLTTPAAQSASPRSDCESSLHARVLENISGKTVGSNQVRLIPSVSWATIDNLKDVVYPEQWELQFPLDANFNTGNYLKLVETRPELYKIHRSYKKGQILEVVSPLGARLFFKVTKGAESALLERTTFQKAGIDHATWNRTGYVGDIPKTFRLNRLQINDLVERLTVAQMAASSTAKKQDRERLKAKIMQANRHAVSILKKRRAFQMKDISSINEMVTTGSLTAISDVFIGGVFRGTKVEKEYLGTRYKIDLTRTMSSVGEMIPVVYFTAPQDVMKQMKRLVDQINGLTADSGLLDIVRIYRKFIHIHPFGEGNGRTARIILDYCLMKVGFQPLPHEYDVTRNVLYRDETELLRLFEMAYLMDISPVEEI